VTTDHQVDTRAETDRIIHHPGSTQDVETPSAYHRRMTSADAAAESFDREVEIATANSPSTQAAMIVALRNEANRTHDLLTHERQLSREYKEQITIKDEQIARQSVTIEAQRKTLADVTENQEWSRLYGAHQQVADEETRAKVLEDAPLVMGNEGPPLIGVLIIGMAGIGVLLFALARLAGWL